MLNKCENGDIFSPNVLKNKMHLFEKEILHLLHYKFILVTMV